LIVKNPQTRPTVLDIESDAASFDLLDPFNRVFWKDMPKDRAIDAANQMGSQYRLIEATGLDYNAKVVA
jgi:hypothetical protein